MSRILHLLAERTVVQDRLRKEIRSAKDLYGSELSYDQLNELAYLDSICRETLRLYVLSMYINAATHIFLADTRL